MSAVDQCMQQVNRCKKICSTRNLNILVFSWLNQTILCDRQADPQRDAQQISTRPPVVTEG